MWKLYNTGIVLAVVCFCSCQNRPSGPVQVPANHPTVVDLVVLPDCSAAPELESWGKDAVAIAGEWYPKISELLNGEEPLASPAVTIVIKRMDGIAYTSENRITVSANWIERHPDDTGLVVHELVHVVQDYRVPTPAWIAEGIADYIRFFLYENQWDWACRIDPDRSHYTDGYQTSAAFLRWIAGTHRRGGTAGVTSDMPVALESRSGDAREENSRCSLLERETAFIQKLNRSCRDGVYSDDFFVEATGETLDVLWNEFLFDLRATRKTRPGL